jgi:hypothetical protein
MDCQAGTGQRVLWPNRKVGFEGTVASSGVRLASSVSAHQGTGRIPGFSGGPTVGHPRTCDSPRLGGVLASPCMLPWPRKSSHSSANRRLYSGVAGGAFKEIEDLHHGVRILYSQPTIMACATVRPFLRNRGAVSRVSERALVSCRRRCPTNSASETVSGPSLRGPDFNIPNAVNRITRDRYDRRTRLHG